MQSAISLFSWTFSRSQLSPATKATAPTAATTMTTAGARGVVSSTGIAFPLVTATSRDVKCLASCARSIEDGTATISRSVPSASRMTENGWPEFSPGTMMQRWIDSYGQSMDSTH